MHKNRTDTPCQVWQQPGYSTGLRARSLQMLHGGMVQSKLSTKKKNEKTKILGKYFYIAKNSRYAISQI